MHARIVEERSLMDIDVEALVSTHLERCLHAVYRERSLRVVRVDCSLHLCADFAETRLDIVILLSVIVARNPPCGMVPCESELGKLLLYHEVAEVLLVRELIAKSETVVIEAEADGYLLL